MKKESMYMINKQQHTIPSVFQTRFEFSRIPFGPNAGGNPRALNT